MKKFLVEKLPISNTLFQILICLCWAGIQTFQYSKFGIITTDEAAKYLRESTRLLSGEGFTSSQYLLYSTYILFISFCKWLHLTTFGIYLLQTLFSGLSMIIFYRLTKLLTSSETAARIGVFLLTICISYQSWNNHLYTESFFLSLELFFLYSYFKSGLKTSSSLILLPLLLFARPTGILIITAVLVHAGYLALMKNKANYRILITAILLTVLVFTLINSFLSIGGSFDFKRPFVQAHVICDVPQQFNRQIDTTGIQNPNSLQGIMTLVIKNPAFFSNLFLARTKAYFGLTRSHYSKAHNLYLIGFFYPIYLFGLFSLLSLFKTNKATAVFAVAFIGLFYGSVLLTCDDWLNRFFMPIVPILIILSVSFFRRSPTLAH